MNIVKIIRNLICVVFSLTALFCVPHSKACTSAIISADLNPYGRPILWKHRDTSTIDNKIEYVAPRKGDFGYVALFNANDSKLEEAWMGINDTGFAVMNTASYNIKDDNVPNKKMDKEGILMSKALKKCRTIDDFEKLLENYPRPMGVEANFGVIDASGNGAFFETNNDKWVRFNLADAPNGLLVRTNYSHSGREGEGYGYIREADAISLLEPYVDEKSVSADVLTEILSRRFYHDGKKRDFTMDGAFDGSKIVDEDFIPRFKSTATVAIEGCIPTSDMSEVTPEMVANQYIMWTGMGYPPVSEIKAVRCSPDGVDPELKGNKSNGHSALGDEAKKIRNSVFSPGSKKNEQIIDLNALYNMQGTGYAQEAISKNMNTYRIERAIRDGK